MCTDTNVLRRGAVYYVRMRVPSDLRERFGRREIWKSLGTREPLDARTLAAIARVRLLQAFDRVRKLDVKDRIEIEKIIQDYFANEVALDAAIRRSPNSYSPADIPFFRHSTEILEAELKSHLAVGEFSLVQDEAEALLNSDLPPSDSTESGPIDAKDYQKLLQGLLRAKLEATQIAKSRWHGDWSFDTPRDPLLRKVFPSEIHSRFGDGPSVHYEPRASEIVTRKPKSHGGGKTLRELMALYMKQRRTERPEYEKEYEQSLDWFEDYFGASRPAASFTRLEINEYVNFLLDLPSRWKILYPGLRIREAAERNKVDRRPTLKVKTINHGRLGHVSAIFRWAANKGHIPEDPTLGTRVDPPKKKTITSDRMSFDPEDLQRIFHAPLFTGCQSYRKWKISGTLQVRNYRFWLPILAIATGGRLSELAQLHVDDVQEHEGLWFINVTEQDEDGESTGKRVKGTESRRLIPVHPELERVGFINFVADCRRSGNKKLFPDCPQTKTGKFDPVSKWFKNFRVSVGITGSKKVFHSFRHNMEDAMRAAGMEDSVRFRLAGRALLHSSSLYGTADTPKIRKTLHEAMSRVEVDCLSHLHGAYPTR